MLEEKGVNLVPQLEQEGTKKVKIKKFCVKLYLNEKEFIDYIKLAEDCKIRPRGLKAFVLKENGFNGERVANTKGLTKFIKNILVPYWVASETERKEKEGLILEQAKKLGLIIKSNL